MAKITLKNLTQNRVHIPRPVNLSLPPQGSVTLDRISDDELARSKKITEMIQKRVIAATVADDPTVDDSIEARLLLASIGTGPTLSNLTPKPLTTVASAGAEAEASRADHSHNHGVQPGGLLHSVATTGSAGFLSNTDKIKLDAIEPLAKDDQTITAGTGLLGGGTGDVTLSVQFGQIASTVTEGNDSRLPTPTQKQALAGTDGSPSNVNRYVTNSDPRNTDPRIPTGPANGDLAGTYPNPRVEAITASGTQLSVGAIADGEILVRSGTSIVGVITTNAPLSNLTPENIGTPGPGISLEASRSDHVHGHGDQLGGTLHAAATAGAAGFMSAADKQKLDGIESSAKDDQTITAGTGLLGGGTGDVSLSVSYGTSAGTATEGNDSRVPTQSENDALAGTNGAPSDVNRYVTNTDPRNSNARTPTAHAISHAAGGTDPITVQNLTSGATGPGLLLAADGAGGLVFTSPTAPGAHATTHAQGAVDELLVQNLGSNTAADGTVATADGLGGVEFEEIPQLAQIVRVAKSGGDYTSVATALASITDASATKPYQVLIAPGLYDEAPFTLQPYVSLVGSGSVLDTVLRTTNNGAHFITGVPGATLQYLSVQGPTDSGFAAIDYTASSALPLFLDTVLIRAGYYGLWCHPTGARGIVHAVFCGNQYTGSLMDTFFRCEDQGFIVATECSFMSGVSAVVSHGFSVDGANATLLLNRCSFSNAGATNAARADNGATLRLAGMVFTQGLTALRVGSAGTGTTVEANNTVIRDAFTNDIVVESATATVQFDGAANKNKITVTAGADFSASFADMTTGEEGHVVFGELWLGTDAQSIPLRSYGINNYSTGYVSGGAVTINAGLNVDITAGVGFVNDGVGVTEVNWTGATIGLTPDARQWVYVDIAGLVQASTTEPNKTLNIVLAVAHTSTTGVPLLTQYPISVSQTVGRNQEYFESVLGPISVSGGEVTIHTPPSLQLAVTAATYYAANLLTQTASVAPISFTYWYRDGAGDWTHVTGQTALDPNNYDDGSGTLAAVPAGQFKRDTLFVTLSAAGTEFHVVYGQLPHATQLLAEQSDDPVVPVSLSEVTLRLASAITQQGSTITSVLDLRPRIGRPSGAAGGQLGGTYPNPYVTGIRETSGPQNLTFGAIPDGYSLRRVGTDILGVNPTDPARVVTVATNALGADATNIADALTVVGGLTPAPSASDPVAILVYPGVYSTAPFVLPAYVTLVGIDSVGTTVLSATTTTSPLMSSAGLNSVRRLTLRGANGAGGVGLSVTGTAGTVVTDELSIDDCTTGVRCVGTSYSVDLRNTNISQGTDGIFVDGSSAQARLYNVTLADLTYGLHVGTTGPTTVTGEGFAVTDGATFVYEVWVDQATGVLTLSNSRFREDKALYDTSADITVVHSSTTPGDAALQVITELHVGSEDRPRESAFGGGDSHTRRVVYLTNTNLAAGTWNNITTQLATQDAVSAPLFAGTAVDNTFYVGGEQPFPGIKATVTTARLGGSVAVDYWNGTAWTPIRHMSTDADSPYGHYAQDIFARVNSEQVRFSDRTGWAPLALNGITKYWVRFRVATVLTTIPAADRIKVHTDRTEINADGVVEYFGAAEPQRQMIWHRKLMEELTGFAQGDVSIAIAPDLSISGVSNRFQNGAKDGSTTFLEFPVGLDTSRPLIYEAGWYKSAAGVGDIEMQLDVVTVNNGAILDGTLAYTQQLSEIVTVDAIAALALTVTTFEINVPDLTSLGSLVLALYRDATNGNLDDTFNGDSVHVFSRVYGTFWR